MLSIVENSPDEEIRRTYLRYYPGPYINSVLQEYEKTIPLRVIQSPLSISLFTRSSIFVHSSSLMSQRAKQKRARMFKPETPFKKLVSETAVPKIDRAHVRRSVAKSFRRIMFSHKCEGRNQRSRTSTRLIRSGN